jgi:hypothetical protein
MAKTKKYNSFREFYEDEERPRKKPKAPEVTRKNKDKMKKKFRFLDPKNMREEDFDEFEDYQ